MALTHSATKELFSPTNLLSFLKSCPAGEGEEIRDLLVKFLQSEIAPSDVGDFEMDKVVQEKGLKNIRTIDKSIIELCNEQIPSEKLTSDPAWNRFQDVDPTTPPELIANASVVGETNELCEVIIKTAKTAVVSDSHEQSAKTGRDSSRQSRRKSTKSSQPPSQKLKEESENQVKQKRQRSETVDKKHLLRKEGLSELEHTAKKTSVLYHAEAPLNVSSNDDLVVTTGARNLSSRRSHTTSPRRTTFSDSESSLHSASTSQSRIGSKEGFESRRTSLRSPNASGRSEVGDDSSNFKGQPGNSMSQSESHSLLSHCIAESQQTIASSKSGLGSGGTIASRGASESRAKLKSRSERTVALSSRGANSIRLSRTSVLSREAKTTGSQSSLSDLGSSASEMSLEKKNCVSSGLPLGTLTDLEEANQKDGDEETEINQRVLQLKQIIQAKRKCLATQGKSFLTFLDTDPQNAGTLDILKDCYENVKGNK